MAQATIVTTVTGLQGRAVASAAPATGQALVFNGTNWTPDNTTFVKSAGGTMTGVLTSTSSIIAGAAGSFQLPVTAAFGTVMMQQPVSWQYYVNCYYDGTNLRQMPGSGTGNATALGAGQLFVDENSIMVLQTAPIVADNAVVTLENVAAFGSLGCELAAPLSINASSGGGMLSLNQIAAAVDCQLYMQQTEHVYILGTAPSNSSFYIFDETNGGFRFSIDPGGGVSMPGIVTCGWCLPPQDNAGYCGAPGQAWGVMSSYEFAQQSDPRNKRDVAAAPAGALDKVKALNVITYRTIEPPPVPPLPAPAIDPKRPPPTGIATPAQVLPKPNYDQLRTGFDASQLQTIHPDAVTVDESGAATGYSLSDMNALLWQAVQELSAKVAALGSK